MLAQDGNSYGRGAYQYSASVTVSAMVAAKESKTVNKEGFAFISWTHHRQNKNAHDCVAVVTASALCEYWITKDGRLEVGQATLHRVEEVLLYKDGNTRLDGRYGTAKICKELIKANYYDDYCEISREIVEAVIKETALARLEHGIRVALECELDIKP